MDEPPPNAGDARNARGSPKRPSRCRRVAVYGGLYVLLAIMLTFGGCGDRLILFPSTQPLRCRGTEHSKSPPRAGGRSRCGPRDRPAPPRASNLARSCSSSTATRRAEPMAAYVAEEWGRRPVEVWAVNYPGYGGSPGPAAEVDPARDARRLRRAEAGRRRPPDLPQRPEPRHDRRPPRGGQSRSPAYPLEPAAAADMILGFGWWNLWLIATPVALSVPSELDSLANARLALRRRCSSRPGDSVVPLKYQAKVSAPTPGSEAVRPPAGIGAQRGTRRGDDPAVRRRPRLALAAGGRRHTAAADLPLAHPASLQPAPQ